MGAVNLKNSIMMGCPVNGKLLTFHSGKLILSVIYLVAISKLIKFVTNRTIQTQLMQYSIES